jgi:hypothetical protein
MGDIYVDIGPMDSGKAPKQYADKAKTVMQEAVKKAVKGASGFTTDKRGDGYTIRLKIAELKVDPKGVSCKLTGELLRYPKPEMVTTSLTGGAKADGGKPDTLVADCIEGAIEGMMKKVIPEMKKQARS